MKMKRLLSLLLVLSMVCGMFTVAVHAETAAQVYDLRVNDLAAPVGLDDPTPSFSWKMKSDAIGAAQSAYSITVTDGETELWNTGWVESDDSVAVEYKGAALQSSTEYTVSVAIKDEKGNATAPASTTFEMALLEENAFADARWITYQQTANAAESLTKYSIEFDFVINESNQGFAFGMKDSGTFVLWQVSTVDGKSTNSILLRPHFKSGGSWTAYPGGPGNVKAVDITAAIGYSGTEVIGKVVHERIEVDGATVKTYFGKSADAMTLAATYTHSAAIPLGKIGFRHNGSGPHENASYDNFVICDGDGKVVYSNDFSSGKTGFSGTDPLTIENGMLRVGKVGGSGEQVFLQVSDNNNRPGYRKSVQVKAGLVSAKLYTSGLGVYENFINGDRVGNKKGDEVVYDQLKPGYTEGEIRRHYSTYDVTWMLSEGENVLASVVTDGWWSANDGLHKQGNESAYIAKLILTYADGSREVINTDTTWKSAKAANVQDGTTIYNGERYDARVSDAWMKPGYDDSAWNYVKVSTEKAGQLCAWDGTPIIIREDLEQAPQTMTVYQGATGASSGFYGKINVLATYEDGQDIVLNPGETLLVDFGQNFVGWEAFTVTSEAGTTIHVEHGEMTNDGNGATSRGCDGPEGSLYNASYRGASADTYYTTAGGEKESWHPMYSFYGFRYAEFTTDATITIHDIRGEVVTSVWNDTASMTTSDKDVNQLLSNVNWSMYGNYLSVPTDCPQRNERLGWLGDTQVFSQTGMYLGENKSFLEKFLQDIRDNQRSDGAYPDISPNSVEYGGYGGIGWADCGIIVPYNLYVMYGDTQVIRDSWDSMVKFMDNYLGTKTYGGSHSYGDWLSYESNSTEGKNMLGTCYHAWDALMMVEMANAIGDTESAAKYQAVYEAKKALFQKDFVNADGTVHVGTQAVCLYALFVDMVDDPQPVVDQLIANIERNGNKLQTGFLGTAIITETLTKIGRSDVAYKLLLQHDNPSWLYSVDQGATTIWERWNSYTKASGFGDVSMNSFNHYSYGDVVGWMYNGMAGIGYDKTNPGFKHIILAPQPDQSLPTVEASFDSPYGEIVSSMNYAGNIWNYTCTVPANTTATIQLPVEKIESLTANGSADLTAVNGLTYAGYADGIATFEAVAGTYSFATEIVVYHQVNIAVNAPADVPPTEAVVYVNGEVAASGLPASLRLETGDVVTAEVTLLNNVDYVVSDWTVGETVVSEGAALSYTVDGNANVAVNVDWVGYSSLAQGKPVTAGSAGNEWAAAFLTDGILSYQGGTNGWSSSGCGKDPANFAEVSAIIDLGSTMEFNRFHIYPRNVPTQSEDVGVMNCPTSYTIYVSNDNATWTPAYSTTTGAVTNGYEPVVIELDQAASGRYVKLGVTAVNHGDEWGNVYVQLSEFGIYYVEKTDADAEAAAAVDAAIEAIGEVTLESEAAIVAARTAYDALTEAGKAKVTKLDTLTAAEAALAALKEAAAQEAADKAAAAAVDAAIEAIGEVTLESEAAIVAARTAYTALNDAAKAYVTKLDVLAAAEAALEELKNQPVDTTVAITVSGADTSFAMAEEVTYTVSASNMDKLATAMLTIAIPTDVLANPVAESTEDWYVIGQVYNNGVLTVVVGCNAGCTGEADLVTISAEPTGNTGDATITVTAATLSAYVDEGETYVEADLTAASFTTVVFYNAYDVNRDGIVDQLDLTRAQRYYGTDNEAADVNDDNVVDIQDLILILNHYDDPEF